MIPKISVAIPTMGRETLFHTLRSLERQTVRPYEVLIVNQGDPSLSFDSNLPIRHLHQDVRGLSRARNRAIETFEGDWILFTDDDQEVNAEWVEQAGLLVQAFPEADLLGGPVFPPIRYDPEREFVSQTYAIGDRIVDAENYLVPTGHPLIQNDIWGGNFALSRNCIKTVGRYDECFGRGSGHFDVGEDTDFVMRAMSANLKGVSSCRLIIYHTYGARPYTNALTQDNIELAAALNWKATQPNPPVKPELASRIQPFGRKKAALANLTRGLVFSNHGALRLTYDATMTRLNDGWRLADGCLIPPA